MALIVMVLLFFARLKRSEALLSRLQASQEQLLERMYDNAELEQELVASFSSRQDELRQLNLRLEERAVALQRLLDQAEGISRSPQFLRELIITGKKKGRTSSQLAKATGLSLDEVELILAQAEN